MSKLKIITTSDIVLKDQISGSIERIHKLESKISKYFVFFTLDQKEAFNFDNYIKLPSKAFLN